MDEKISLTEINLYSDKFASSIADEFFSTREKITGAEIRSLCDIHQINLFVIRELLYSWKAESEKLESPYFNYHSKEVADALTLFQNTLSNNILIAKSDFVPLLVRATSRTLNLIFSPYDFYAESLDRDGGGFIHVANLKNDIRYLKINRAPMEKLVQKLEQRNLSMVQRNEAFALLDNILEEVGFQPEDIEGYVSAFSRILPLEIEKLYESKQSEDAQPTESKPGAQPLSQAANNQPAVSVKPDPANKPTEKTSANSRNLNKIARIKDSLSINQKFMFTKILFHGDFEIFSQAVDRLDNLDSYKQAANYVESTYPEWDKESAEYLEFREMLERRFG